MYFVVDFFERHHLKPAVRSAWNITCIQYMICTFNHNETQKNDPVLIKRKIFLIRKIETKWGQGIKVWGESQNCKTILIFILAEKGISPWLSQWHCGGIFAFDMRVWFQPGVLALFWFSLLYFYGVQQLYVALCRRCGAANLGIMSSNPLET